MNEFEGFDIPEQNWSKLPHALIDALHYMKGGELKVVLYILRHTWGFQEYGIVKKITIDEFMSGRKRRDRTRMDSGCGLSKQGVINGLKQAIENGFIEVVLDDRDKARKVRSYMLCMSGTDVQDFDIKDKKVDIEGQNSRHRTEKETIEKNIEIDTVTPTLLKKLQKVVKVTPEQAKEWAGVETRLEEIISHRQANACIEAQIVMDSTPEMAHATIDKYSDKHGLLVWALKEDGEARRIWKRTTSNGTLTGTGLTQDEFDAQVAEMHAEEREATK